MSLINDALKKTQQARASAQDDDSLMNSPGTTTTTSSKSGSPWPWIFGMVALVVIAVPVSIWLLQTNSSEDTVESSPLADMVVDRPEPIAQSEPVAPTPVAPEPAEAAPSTPDASEAQPTAEPTPEEAPKKPQEKTGPITADPRIVELLKTITVTGVLLSNGTEESKILLDGQVYTKNAIIDSQLSCRIAEINQNSVVFTDESGVRYTKRF
ncbi:MAG: hypothetical protein ACPGN3_16865 [Opitutales bacterium]